MRIALQLKEPARWFIQHYCSSFRAFRYETKTKVIIKLLKNTSLFLAFSGLIFFGISGCNKQKIENLENQVDKLQKDSSKMDEELSHHHCIYSELSSHDLDDSYEFTSMKLYIWTNRNSATDVPSNTSSGYDVGPKTVEITQYTTAKPRFFVDGFKEGFHYVYGEGTATDSSGTHTMVGGEMVEIAKDEHCSDFVHIHTHKK